MWPFKRKRRPGLYRCSGCKYLFVFDGRQWFGALWPVKNSPLIDGYLSRISNIEDKYADCAGRLVRQ